MGRIGSRVGAANRPPINNLQHVYYIACQFAKFLLVDWGNKCVIGWQRESLWLKRRCGVVLNVLLLPSTYPRSQINFRSQIAYLHQIHATGSHRSLELCFSQSGHVPISRVIYISLEHVVIFVRRHGSPSHAGTLLRPGPLLRSG